MSSHDDRFAGHNLPSNTGEFRAAPDASASTAQFKAFARAYDSQPEQPWAADSWPAQPDAGVPVRPSSRRALMIAAAVVAVVVVIVIALLVIG